MQLFAPCPGRVDAAKISSIVDERMQRHPLLLPSQPPSSTPPASILCRRNSCGRPDAKVQWLRLFKIYGTSSLHLLYLQVIITKHTNPPLIISAALFEEAEGYAGEFTAIQVKQKARSAAIELHC
jgi:hypothetical protein